MIRRIALSAIAACAVVATAAFPAGSAPLAVTGVPAGSRSSLSPSAALDVSSVSPWADPDGVFSVGFAPSTQVPSDGRFRYSVHQRLVASDKEDLVDEVAEAVENGPPERLLQEPVDLPVSALGDPVAGLQLDIPLRSGSGSSERVLIPTAGVHPVTLQLLSAQDEEIWSATVFLNRLPDDRPLGADGQPAVTAVQLVAGIDSSPALDAQGAPSFGEEELAAITSLQGLLTELRSIPMMVALRPNTIEGLRLSGDPVDAQFLSTARSASWTLARQSYVRVDAAALASSGDGELARQVGVGDLVGAGTLGRSADNALWLLDDTVDTAAAKTLNRLGIRHFVMSAERFETELGGRARSTRVFAVEGVGDSTVSSFDGALTGELLDTSDDPTLVAHRISTRLMADWFDAVGGRSDPFPGVVASIVVPPGASAEALLALADPLTGDGPLQLRDFPTATPTGDDVARARLLPRSGADLSAVVARTEAVGARIDGYRSMTSSTDPAAITWDLVNDQTPALFIDETEREQMWNVVDAQIGARIGLIELPPPRTVVLTSRTGTIPLRFRNGLDREVRLVMHTRSSRLGFPSGDTTEISLAPGENRLDVPVVVQAPGSSLMRIELTAPDGSIRLPETTVTVRSSSISGVGAALSAISLAFLAFWWLRTHRRRREATR